MLDQDIYQVITNIKKGEKEYENFQVSIVNELNIPIGFLKPITFNLINYDNEILPFLTKWRRMFIKYFLTQFTPTVERTSKWLKEIVIPSEDRILFLIYSSDGTLIGNFGVCNVKCHEVELDNLIRGEKGGDLQLIYYAEVCLLRWIFSQFEVSSAVLHVFSNNQKTISLHEKVGFKIVREYRLWKESFGEEIIYSTINESGELAKFTYLEMCLTRDEFTTRYPISLN